MTPYAATETLLRHVARRHFGLSVEDAARLVVRLDAPPLGVRWIACPAGYVLAPVLRRKPVEIAADLAREVARWVPSWWGQEVESAAGHVNVRWA